MIDGNWKGFFDDALVSMYNDSILDHLLLVVLYEGQKHPLYCAPMPVDPEPELGIPINDFLTIYKNALTINEAIKDGAVMVRLPGRGEEYPIVTGWSYRLFAPPLNVKRQVNRGSGYNSSLDFSDVEGVSSVYLVNTKDILRFEHGSEIILQSNEIGILR